MKRLVTLCDNAPSTRFGVVKQIIEKELGREFDEVFEQFDEEPVGSASIAQVGFLVKIIGIVCTN